MSSRKLIAVALMAVVLAGCSSKSDTKSNNTSNNTSNQASLPQCPTAATLNSGLGVSVGEPATSNQSKERNCLYNATDGASPFVTVHFQILAAATDFDATKVGMSAGGRTVADVQGLGDKAFSSVRQVGGVDNNIMAALKGKLMVVVTSSAPLDKEKAFVATLLG